MAQIPAINILDVVPAHVVTFAIERIDETRAAVFRRALLHNADGTPRAGHFVWTREVVALADLAPLLPTILNAGDLAALTAKVNAGDIEKP